MSSNQLTIHDNARSYMPAMTVAEWGERYRVFVDFVRNALVADKDYGKIPGTDKPTLLQPGAEKLCKFFGLCVDKPVIEEKVEDWAGKDFNGEPFFFYRIRQDLSANGVVVASREGSCNSRETKYRWRNQERKCPECGKPTIFRSKKRDNDPPDKVPGWYCWNKKGGCGINFPYNVESIINQTVGRIPNPDIADQVNTILQIAQKRALISATKVATNSSEFFTMADDGEIPDAGRDAPPPQQSRSAPPKQHKNGPPQQDSGQYDDGGYQEPPEPPRQQAPASAPKPAPSPDPTNGVEFLKLAAGYQDRLVKAGKCREGEVLIALRSEALQCGYSDDIATWEGESLKFGLDVVKDIGLRMQKEYISRMQQAEIVHALAEHNVDEDAMAAHFGIESLAKMPAGRFGMVMEYIRSAPRNVPQQAAAGEPQKKDDSDIPW